VLALHSSSKTLERVAALSTALQQCKQQVLQGSTGTMLQWHWGTDGWGNSRVLVGLRAVGAGSVIRVQSYLIPIVMTADAKQDASLWCSTPQHQCPSRLSEPPSRCPKQQRGALPLRSMSTTLTPATSKLLCHREHGHQSYCVIERVSQCGGLRHGCGRGDT